LQCFVSICFLVFTTCWACCSLMYVIFKFNNRNPSMRNSKPKYHKAIKGSFSSCKEWLLTSQNSQSFVLGWELSCQAWEIASQYGSYNHVPGDTCIIVMLVHMWELASSAISTLVISDQSIIIKQSKDQSQAARKGCQLVRTVNHLFMGENLAALWLHLISEITF